MGVKPIQIGLPLQIEGDAFASTTTTESPVGKEQLMELIVRSENLQRALKRVKQNKGAAGVDQMGTEQLADHLKQHWASIKQQLLAGTYQPQPVKRVEIPKPDGSKRLLGIPALDDKIVQKGAAMILTAIYEQDFLDCSYGYRLGKGAKDVVEPRLKGRAVICRYADD